MDDEYELLEIDEITGEIIFPSEVPAIPFETDFDDIEFLTEEEFESLSL